MVDGGERIVENSNWLGRSKFCFFSQVPKGQKLYFVIFELQKLIIYIHKCDNNYYWCNS